MTMTAQSDISQSVSLPVPQYGTRRRPERPTYGHLVAEAAVLMGFELQEWQRYVADVAGELIPNPDNPDELVPAYPTVSLSVGRRAGKTKLMFAIVLARMMQLDGCRAFFTAQNLAASTAAFQFDLLPTLVNVDHKARMGNGKESVQIGGSLLRLFAPTPASLHGSESDLTWVDEVWKFSAERGDELEVAIRPLMATRPQAQFFLTSAAGTLDSGWWNRTLELGRDAAERDSGEDHAHFEWGVEGTGADLDDESTWKEFHPGHLVPLKWMRAEHARNAEQFYRTVLNRTDRSSSVLHAISRRSWDLCLWPGAAPSRDELFSLAFDVEPDGVSSTIVACLGHADFLEVVDHRPGTAWVVPRLAELFERFDMLPVAYDNRAPAGVLESRLHQAGVPVRTVGLGEGANAAAGFADLIHRESIRHEPSDLLDQAVDGAHRRLLGDGGWSFSRTKSTSPVSPLIAASLAWYAHPLAHGDATPRIH